MNRLVLVYNRRSSKHALIEREVLSEARKLSGWMVAKYEVKNDGLQENAKSLARILMDRDLLVVAGGDGTANMALNAIIESGKKVTLGVLGYGNFSDFAGMLGTISLADVVRKFEKKQVKELYPLKIEVNDELWRYAGCYATVGMAAEVTKIFDQEKVRTKLSRRAHWFSYLKIAFWYYKNRFRRIFVPKMRLNGAPQKTMTDIIALNSPRMASVMRGKDWCWRKKVFGAGSFKLKWSVPLFFFMMKSMFNRVPVSESEKMLVEFDEPANVVIQAEGEYEDLEGVRKIAIEKGSAVLVVS